MYSCVNSREVKVLRSNAGYYIGTIEEGFPYCRISGYFSSKEEAQSRLRAGFIAREAMEVNFCNGGDCGIENAWRQDECN